MVRLILFLVRLKLGVKKNVSFKFANQKADCRYYIGDDCVWKTWWDGGCHRGPSNVGINWLLSPDCKIERE